MNSLHHGTDATSAFVALLGRLSLAATHLLRLQVLVQEEQGRLVGLGASHDGEHALAGLVMGCLLFESVMKCDKAGL